MKEIQEVIAALKQLSGKKQVEFLKQYKDNQNLKEILFYTYNPNMKFNINEAKLDKAIQKYEFSSEICNFGTDLRKCLSVDIPAWLLFRDCLDVFASAKGVKEADVDKMIETFWGNYNNDELNIFKGIILKDLRINMNISSFNKVWDDFYVVPEVMLAKKFEGKMPANPYLSRKFDGMRAFYLDGKFYSRTYKELNAEPLKHIYEQLKDLPSEYVLDGELIYFKDETFKEDFQKTVALVAKEEYQEGCEKIYYVVFDCIQKEEFLKKKCTAPFKDTYQELSKILGIEKANSSSIPYGVHYTEYDNIVLCLQSGADAMPTLMKLVERLGWEGIMVRDSDKPYECKRTSALQKIKKMDDAEFDIVGFKEGSGKFEGTLGTITICLKTGESVDVGSGYSDADREYIWNNQKEILDSKVKLKVQFFERTQDKNGNNSLRFPVFLCFRDADGNESVRL